ncbi:hypothetical protein Tco_0337090 [Tanacetum coccineum]
MQTRSSSSKFVNQSSTNPPSTSTNPKHRNRRRSKQRVEPFALEETPIVTMADQRTMAERLRAPTEGYAEAIVVPQIPAEHFELKHSLINLITSTLKYKDVPETSIKLMLFSFSIDGPARIWLDKEPPCSILTWDDLDLLRACPHHGFTELHQLDTFYNGLNPSDQDSLYSAAGGNLLERTSAVSSVVTSAMTEMLKKFQPPPAPASVKPVEESCVTCGGAHSYRQCPATDGNTFSGFHDNIQGYVSVIAATNYNQGNAGYRPQSVANQVRPPVPIQTPQVATSNDLEKLKKMNNVKNELRNEMQSLIQASMSNQTNELKNMMATFFQMNIPSTSGSGSLPRNTVANPKGKLKAITTRSGLVLDGPSVPMPPSFINPEEDEREEETSTDPEHGKFTIKVLPPPVQKAKPPS